AAKHAKLVKLMQKFRPRCLVRIFCNERSQSTLLDPKLMFWFVSFCLGPFRTVSLLHKICCKTRQTGAINAKVHAMMSRSRSTPLEHKLMFWCVSFRLGAFGTVSLLHETRCKWAKLVQLMQEFVPQSLVRISRNRHTRSTQFDPMLMFSCVSFLLGAFGTIMLLHKLDAKHAKLVQLMQKFVPRGLVSNFYNERPQSIPLDPKLMFWCVSFCSGAFWTV